MLTVKEKIIETLGEDSILTEDDKLYKIYFDSLINGDKENPIIFKGAYKNNIEYNNKDMVVICGATLIKANEYWLVSDMEEVELIQEIGLVV